VNSVGTATQAAPRRKPHASRTLVLCLVVVALVLEILHWWLNGGQEQVLLALQPDFTVINIDHQAKTMTLSRAQEGFIVSCDDSCDVFKLGKKYPMFERGPMLEYRRSGKKIKLPVLQEHVDFQTPPGGHG
jgi:hypothetical protein